MQTPTFISVGSIISKCELGVHVTILEYLSGMDLYLLLQNLFFFFFLQNVRTRPQTCRTEGLRNRTKNHSWSLWKCWTWGILFSAYANSVYNAFWLKYQGHPDIFCVAQSLNKSIMYDTQVYIPLDTGFLRGTERLFHTDVFISKSKSLNSSRVINESGAVCCVLN